MSGSGTGAIVGSGLGGAGGAVRVSFFKSAWGDALIAKDGKAVISGLVRKRGNVVTIVLQNVQ